MAGLIGQATAPAEPPMPDFAPALSQFPVVALAFLAAWVAVKWVDRRHAADLAREKDRADVAVTRADAEIARGRADADRVREADRQVIAWLEADAARLRRRNTKLENQLDAERARRRGEP